MIKHITYLDRLKEKEKSISLGIDKTQLSLTKL